MKTEEDLDRDAIKAAFHYLKKYNDNERIAMQTIQEVSEYLEAMHNATKLKDLLAGYNELNPLCQNAIFEAWRRGRTVKTTVQATTENGAENNSN